MDYKNLIVETIKKIGIVKINRPEVLNAVNIETILELEKVMHEFDDNEDILVIIITGEGKSFVSGSDISKLAQLDALQAREYSQIGQRVLSFIENMEKTVIAAVNGYALGSGCELAMACDIRIASDKAKFGQPEVKLGIIPGHAGTQRLARLVGISIAKELIFTGDIIDAQEALRIGLVNKVIEQESLLEEVNNIANKIVAVGPTAVRLAKTVINRGIDTNLTTASSYETEAFSVVFSTEEAREGIRAFLEKRKPNWNK
ncbi:MAG: enoyl-CoA hydratase/isomerase family protein [Candidatus Marinimicrobia bacterium]|nr:enoyl-CoA hydratase/isomerase family protein [Candidatus Neomarinimicrobiota bacterium]